MTPEQIKAYHEHREQQSVVRDHSIQIRINGEVTDEVPIMWLNEAKPAEPPIWDFMDGCYGLMEIGEDFDENVRQAICDSFQARGIRPGRTDTRSIGGRKVEFTVVYEVRPQRTRPQAPPPEEGFSIEIRTEDNEWRNLGEGPWKSQDEAETFANAEVGVEWRIIYITKAGERNFRARWQLDETLTRLVREARRESLPDEIIEPVRAAYQATPHFKRQAFVVWLFQAIHRKGK